MSSESEQVIIDEILLIARAVKTHLKEPNCTHNIKTIVKEALENRAIGPLSPIAAADINTKVTSQDAYRDRFNK